ncbi:MAG: hypothetical protein ACYC3X_25045 [Pirellulaceae bacterium]
MDPDADSRVHGDSTHSGQAVIGSLVFDNVEPSVSYIPPRASRRKEILMRALRCFFCTLALSTVLIHSLAFSAEIWPEGLQRVRQNAPTTLQLVEQGQPSADIVLLNDSELLRNAADWIADFTRQASGAILPIGSQERLTPNARHIVAVVGDADPLITRLKATHGVRFQLDPRVGAQGYVIQRVDDPQAGELLICWSPEPLGCRYGLIEILRSLTSEGKSLHTALGRVVERPQFSMRIFYLNFAEHLQNAYNPNVLFESQVNRWTLQEWERLIDMLAAFRYNIFEFWLVPTLFSPEAIQGGKIQTEFAATINHVIAYAKRRGVAVHPIQAVNTVGQSWHYHCPHDPQEHAEIVALWDHWSRAMQGNEYIGFFPGDPGGCIRNGCTAETFVDLCLELSKVVRKNNPTVTIEVGTWGEPFAGWGVPLWTGNRQRAEQSMRYFLAKLPEFPAGTFTSINQGFSSDCDPNLGGGDGRPFAKEAAQTRPVLTWDYSVTEGEGTVSPRARIRRIFAQRQAELASGCYSGGICYTMTPKLNCLSHFACAEAFWNPALEPDAVLADYGRLIFGDELAAIGPLLEEFEVIPDWGYYAPFPYSPQRLRESMHKILPLLRKVSPTATTRLPLAPTLAEYRQSLLFFADLFEKLAGVASDLEEARNQAQAAGKIPANRTNLLSLTEVEAILDQPGEFPQKNSLRELSARLRQYDVPALKQSYVDTVYGIYNSGIPSPVDPRDGGAIHNLFNRFQSSLAIPDRPSVLRPLLDATGKPSLVIALGQPGSESGWTLSGWNMQGNDDGSLWRASGDQPGIIARDDFQNKDYQWLVLRLTDGPAGGRKTVAINGTVVAQFVRTGPPLAEKKEWWVTRSYPIPAGLLQDGHLEIRFTEPGVAIAEVALSVARVADSE